MKKPIDSKLKANSQISLVLYTLILNFGRGGITLESFDGKLRLSEYIRLLRHKYNLVIETDPVSFTTQFGQKSEYASYKLKGEIEPAIEVFQNLVLKK